MVLIELFHRLPSSDLFHGLLFSADFFVQTSFFTLLYNNFFVLSTDFFCHASVYFLQTSCYILFPQTFFCTFLSTVFILQTFFFRLLSISSSSRTSNKRESSVNTSTAFSLCDCLSLSMPVSVFLLCLSVCVCLFSLQSLSCILALVPSKSYQEFKIAFFRDSLNPFPWHLYLPMVLNLHI